MIPVLILYGLTMLVIIGINTQASTEFGKTFSAFLLVVFGVLLGITLYIDINTYDCEKNLPRNQECKTIAVPKELPSE